MDIPEYISQFQEILDGKNTEYPYDNEDYVNYVKLNKSRLKRWTKVGKLSPELTETIESIDQTQNWILISEPWCGDAANIQAFIEKSAVLNPNITLSVQNRDAPNSEIENYLTNGGKSIPKLIVRDADGNDLFSWGPRPKEAQEIHLRQRNDDSMGAEEKKIELQKWYNTDKGETTQKELNELFIKSRKN